MVLKDFSQDLRRVAELVALPDILIGFAEVMLKGGFGKCPNHGLDVAIELACADETDIQAAPSRRRAPGRRIRSPCE